ncbi:MAG: hypothetical protein EU541_02830 [Promethearchaeota archaeon]|nr:MAG: hypothetical protein EU541_02830 [Candidatus Lokiarchaeota archaeon]
MNSKNPSENEEAKKDLSNIGFPIIGIGCSAGSLRFLEKFFKNVPDNPEVSFVIVKHLDPQHQSELHTILTKYIPLRVKFIEDREKLTKNVVYIVPPGKNVKLKGYRFHIENPEKPRGHRLPIDFFFRSMAESLQNKSIGVLLSGTGTDGTLGLRDIKGQGGIAIVQDPKEAEYSGMLKSAISHIKIDYILPADEIPTKILRYIKDYVKPYPNKNSSPQTIENLDYLFQSLERVNGQEILVYKKSTLGRRVSKRMAANHIKQIKKYAHFLETHPAEMENLFSEVLIGVTDFFRDEDSFKKLSEIVIPKIVNKDDKDDVIRIWVVGCSTGEEAYTIAILLRDYMNRVGKNNKVMIFGSDANEDAINRARSGVFPENIATNVPDKYLKNYFIHEDSTYRVKKEIRHMIVFSVHNIIIDPPFSDLDLISCRNLLIYIKPNIQKKIIKIFHYSLKKEGFLFLGSSESISSFSSLFSELDRKSKIFKKKKYTNHNAKYSRPFPPLIDFNIRMNSSIPEKQRVEKINYKKLMNDYILKEYSPSSVIINANNEIIYTHGRTGKYLEPTIGKADLNILRMAREDLNTILTTAIKKSRNMKTEIKFENIKVKTNGKKIRINIIVRPIEHLGDTKGLLLIVFDEGIINPIEFTESKFEKITDKRAQKKINQLESELSATRAHLKSTIQQLETTNEELQSTNEEFQSSNEELKSTNEELQSSKEELQSVNEELLTVNNELENKIEDLTILNNDLNNLIRSTQNSTIFLDLNLEIKRFTPQAKEIFNLIDNDVGRSISDISSKLNYDNLINDMLKVEKNLKSIEKDVQTKSNKWYTMHIMPYITEDDQIEGTIITFFDITEKKIAAQKLKKSKQKYKEAYKQAKFYQDLVTHDFNNILTVLNLSLSQLEETTEGINKENVEFLKEQVQRGGRLIHNIQRLSNIHESVAQTTSIDLIDLLTKQIKKLKKTFQNENISITFDYSEEPILVSASNFIEEAILNLLNNTIEHNDSSRKDIEIRIGKYNHNKQEFYKVTIEDNGVGIPDSMKNLIMEGNLSPKKNLKKGLGIGLSIVKKIIDLSNGKMWIENKLEADYTKGTKFVLLLPKYDD